MKIHFKNNVLIIAVFLLFFSSIYCYSENFLNNNHPVKMEMIEIDFNPGVQFSNPYDPDEVEVKATFKLPDNKSESVYGFWYEGFDRSLSNGIEVLTPDGVKTWRIRYTPRMAGTYQYYIELYDHKQTHYTRYPENGFSGFKVSGSSKDGFLKVSDSDKSYFEYSSGKLFLGFGHNLCGWEWPGKYSSEAWNGTDNKTGTYEYDDWLDKMHENKANLAQFDFCESDQLEWTYNPSEFPFSKDWNGLTRYNQETAWKMDYRIRKAENYDIFFRLTLLHWEDFDKEADISPNWGWNRNPYNSVNGGPVQNVSGFFTEEKAKKILKKMLRYINARWGYSRNLLAYEFWNEVDAVDISWGPGKDFKTESGNIVNWHREMASYIRSLDPYKHLLTTSFADSGNDLSVWLLPQIDFTTIHRYTYLNTDYGDEKYATVNTIQKILSQRFLSVNKPVMIGEFALSPGGDIQRLYDKTGIEFHNQLWASIMAKGAVTAMHWNWASYIHKNNLYYNYIPITAFFKGIDLRNTVNINNLLSSPSVIQYSGLKKPDSVYIWIKDKNNNFSNVKNGYIPVMINNQAFQIELNNGRYQLDFYDTYNGQIIKTAYEDCAGGIITVKIPDFIRDIAVKIEKR